MTFNTVFKNYIISLPGVKTKYPKSNRKEKQMVWNKTKYLLETQILELSDRNLKITINKKVWRDSEELKSIKKNPIEIIKQKI